MCVHGNKDCREPNANRGREPQRRSRAVRHAPQAKASMRKMYRCDRERPMTVVTPGRRPGLQGRKTKNNAHNARVDPKRTRIELPLSYRTAPRPARGGIRTSGLGGDTVRQTIHKMAHGTHGSARPPTHAKPSSKTKQRHGSAAHRGTPSLLTPKVDAGTGTPTRCRS